MALFLFALLSSDGIFTAQVGDAPALKTAASGNPDMKGRFDFIDSLQESGFVRIVDYEEVRIKLIYTVVAFWGEEKDIALSFLTLASIFLFLPFQNRGILDFQILGNL